MSPIHLQNPLRCTSRDNRLPDNAIYLNRIASSDSFINRRQTFSFWLCTLLQIYIRFVPIYIEFVPSCIDTNCLVLCSGMSAPGSSRRNSFSNPATAIKSSSSSKSASPRWSKLVRNFSTIRVLPFTLNIPSWSYPEIDTCYMYYL